MNVEDVRRELEEMRKLKMFSEATHLRALRYIENNESEVDGYVQTMGVTGAADLVLAQANCASGRCE